MTSVYSYHGYQARPAGLSSCLGSGHECLVLRIHEMILRTLNDAEFERFILEVVLIKIALPEGVKQCVVVVRLKKDLVLLN